MYSKYSKIILYCTGAGMETFTNATILSSPAGTLVNVSTNTFSYRILSSVNLTCDTVPTASAIFAWTTDGCTGCFPSGQTVQVVSENILTLEDAGTFTCNASGNNTVTSDPFTIVVDCKLAMYCTYMWLEFLKDKVLQNLTHPQKQKRQNFKLVKELVSQNLFTKSWKEAIIKNVFPQNFQLYSSCMIDTIQWQIQKF